MAAARGMLCDVSRDLALVMKCSSSFFCVLQQSRGPDDGGLRCLDCLPANDYLVQRKLVIFDMLCPPNGASRGRNQMNMLKAGIKYRQGSSVGSRNASPMSCSLDRYCSLLDSNWCYMLS